MMKKVIVFGGAGFLGSHVADALTDAGYQVTIFDIVRSPYLRSEQEMIEGDILSPEQVGEAIDGHQIVFHFAGIADIDECNVRPVDTIKFNVMGTTQILEECCKMKVERFIFASSAYVNSQNGYFYRTSKQTCETLIEDYHAVFGLNYTCLRYGSLYGERADGRNSIYKLLKQAIVEGKIVYHGTGDEIREFIHVKDAAQCSVRILDPEFENQHIVLTGNQTMRYDELLEMIKEIMADKISIEIMPSKRKAHYKITPYNFCPKLGKKLISNPYIDMGQGLMLCMAEIHRETQENKLGLFVGV